VCPVLSVEGRRRSAVPHGAPGGATEVDDGEAPAEERAVVCTACEAPITSARARCERAGKHRHTCANAHGYVFEIVCFSPAPGVRGEGGWETFFSWFPGYAWQIALCAGCGAHVGWSFRASQGSNAEARRGEGEPFAGLRTDRVAEREP